MPTDLLDDPVWNSLVGPHREFALGQGAVQRYPNDMAPFVAVDWNSQSWETDLAGIVAIDEEVVLVGGPHNLEFGAFQCTKLSFADQMVYQGGLPPEDETNIIQLTASHTSEMIRLMKEVYPGYFRQSTSKMGRYYGIFLEDRLVAMAGERLRPSGYQELSGIATLPDFRGKGLASKLTAWAAHKALKAEQLPFLHVDADNIAAIKVYERLGFKKRRTLPIRRLRKACQQ